MPPVRWKLLMTVLLLCVARITVYADSMHESVPMTSDGWRPIIGTINREPGDEVLLYKNPSQQDENSEPIKAQPIPIYTPPPTSSTKPYKTISTIQDVPAASTNNEISPTIRPQDGKIPAHAKHKPYMMVPGKQNRHPPHIPLTASGRIPRPRYPNMNKPRHPPNKKRRVKPMRGSMIAHSMKHEVIVPAPSAAIGTFAYYNQPQIPSKNHHNDNKHIHYNQPQSHIDYNQFGLSGIHGIPGTNDVIIQQVPVQTYILQNRNPIQNNGNLYINPNDQYTRNLVPPPYNSKPNGNKQKEQGHLTNEQPPHLHNPQLVIGKHKEPIRHKPVIPENVVVQLPPPFPQSHFESSFGPQHTKERDPVEVQVTKEKLKVYHNNIPINYSPVPNQYQQFELHSVNKPLDQSQIYAYENFDISKQKQEPKLHSFRKPVAESFSIFNDGKHESYRKPLSEPPQSPTYEVTEGKPWQDRYQPFLSTRPPVTQAPLTSPTPTRVEQQPLEFVFLPTPYDPDSAVPTASTQDEISTIYAELNHRKRPSTTDYYSTLDPNIFNIKDVSTHYPIVGRPESPTVYSRPANSESLEFSNDITTTTKENKPEPVQTYQQVEELESTTRIPTTRDWQSQRHRPQQRRRKPTQRVRTTTTEETIATTEPYDVHKVQYSSEENYSNESQQPQRRRRPTRIRTSPTTTEFTRYESTSRPTYSPKQRYRNRYENNRPRPISSIEIEDEMPTNHKKSEPLSYSVLQPVDESYISGEIVTAGKPQRNPENTQTNLENEVARTEILPEIKTETYPKTLNYGRHYDSDEGEEEDVTETVKYKQSTRKPEIETQPTTTEEIRKPPKRRYRLSTTPSTTTTTTTKSTTTTTLPPETSINIIKPENEVDYDYSTPLNNFEPSKETITIQEVYDTKNENENEATVLVTSPPPPPPSPPTSTTTEITTTTKPSRVRARPVKYDNKNRPRFSVKDYRQRLNQYTSTTTESTRITTETSRSRFAAIRSRKPVLTNQEDEPTERSKFTPKDPRHNTASISGNDKIPEKKINTRLRPFNRSRGTTEATTTTQKVSIKPNIFSSLRRPPPISLRQKIYNKYNRTSPIEKTTSKPDELDDSPESSNIPEVTIINNNTPESPTEVEVTKAILTEHTTEEADNEELANTEIMKHDSFLLSQRVSDLTSSAHKEYDTPGLFKSVSPNSRIVPSYFTISTDDPILPIEAFFPNIKDKSPKNDT